MDRNSPRPFDSIEAMLDAAVALQRSITLRNPYVDSLSEMQVMLLARLRAMPEDDPDREEPRLELWPPEPEPHKCGACRFREVCEAAAV